MTSRVLTCDLRVTPVQAENDTCTALHASVLGDWLERHITLPDMRDNVAGAPHEVVLAREMPDIRRESHLGCDALSSLALCGALTAQCCGVQIV